MREILFKAKRKDNNEWVEGCIWTMLDNSDGPITKKYFIRDKNYSVYGSYSWKDYEVIQETISQYTGLTDKNGVKIFENDILCRNDKRYGEEKGQVIYERGTPTINYKNVYTPFNHTCIEDWEIIGNIFDEEVK